jgi:predicted NAD/FAD-binding protein
VSRSWAAAFRASPPRIISAAPRSDPVRKVGAARADIHTPSTVESSAGPIAIDMGFIVHNDRTYPNLVRLFAELGVRTQPSDMSFAVFSREKGFEYSSRGLAGFFAQRRNLLRPDTTGCCARLFALTGKRRDY